MQQQDCQRCGKIFNDYRSNRRKFCSQNCRARSQEINHSHVCKECNVIFTDKIKTSKFCTLSCAGKFNVRLVKNHRGGAGFGKDHWNWKGGNLRGNRGSEQRRFRKAVLKRDNYTCVICGQKNKPLIADHIKPYAFYPELREVIDNGRTLCKDCNYETTYINKDWKLA